MPVPVAPLGPGATAGPTAPAAGARGGGGGQEDQDCRTATLPVRRAIPSLACMLLIAPAPDSTSGSRVMKALMSYWPCLPVLEF